MYVLIGVWNSRHSSWWAVVSLDLACTTCGGGREEYTEWQWRQQTQKIAAVYLPQLSETCQWEAPSTKHFLPTHWFRSVCVCMCVCRGWGEGGGTTTVWNMPVRSFTCPTFPFHSLVQVSVCVCVCVFLEVLMVALSLSFVRIVSAPQLKNCWPAIVGRDVACAAIPPHL